jgi:2-polyprenyl-6-methoxyphenol hydroxylase-like FAD-dependent oxidoreductase
MQVAHGASRVDIAVVGSGPGGLSAAARAAELGMSHVLLEAAPQLPNTIYRYQKGKHVMAEPGICRCAAPCGSRPAPARTILDKWDEGVATPMCVRRPKWRSRARRAISA